MRIAFIGQKGIPAKFGGVERHVEELASEMAKMGHEVFVYVRNNYTPKEIKEYKGIKLIHLPSIGTKNLDAISHTFLASIHALFADYDVIHYQAIGPSILSWMIKIFKRKTVLISTFHCQDYYHKKWGILAKSALKFGEWSSCKAADKTVVVSDSLEIYAKEKYAIEPELIYNGARIEDDFNGNFLDKWNLKRNRYIVFVGRLIRHKGAHTLIEAFKELEKEGKIPPNFKLVIVGDGFHTDDYASELKDSARNSGNIIFTGNLEGKELRSIFAGAYLFVQPSEAEGLSIALLEAMSYQVLVLASDIKENTDVIKDMGYTFKTNDANDLAEKLDNLLNLKTDFKDKTDRAKREVLEKYDWEKIAQKTIRLYKREICTKREIHCVTETR
jgi:glycosyltransferase involved in cell wall biosynthesis